jgi:hypothetical protein
VLWRNTEGYDEFTECRLLRKAPVTANITLQFLGYAETAACLAALILLLARKRWSTYWALGWFLIAHLLTGLGLPVIIHFADRLGKRTAYETYFYVYWVAFGLESVLTLLVLYNLLRVTMGPLRGLQRLASLAFCAVVLLAVFWAATSVLSHHIHSEIQFVVAAISQLQRTQSMVAILMLLTVVPALRLMGLSFRSPVFGVALGLGILAINDVLWSQWLTSHPYIGTGHDVIHGLVPCTIMTVWAVYFALPEPERHELALPAGSPLLRWNRMWLD